MEIPILTCDNHDSWFHRYKVKLTGKGVYYVVQQPMIQACQITVINKLAKRVDVLDLKEDAKAKSASSDTMLNVEKKEKYLRDKATAIDYIFRS